MDIVETADGSHTLASPYPGEHYHSTHGALCEGQHVFVRHGVADLGPRARIGVLEMGFGTGLNALLTRLFAQQHRQPIDYVAIEAKPLDAALVAQLNYPQIIEESGARFAELHDLAWGSNARLDAFFSLKKVHVRIEEADLSERFDVVYYDAFGPAYQPELWTREAFARMYKVLVPGGVLVTYCAKGQVKRDLRAVGFAVESLPGPPGKREMTRARKVA